MDDTTLFRVVLHLLVVFTEQLFAALVSSGGNSRLSLAALNNRDFVVRTGHFVSLLSVIGGWGGVLPPHFGQKKSRRPFSDFLLGVPLCGRRVFSCKSSGQVDPMCGWQTGINQFLVTFRIVGYQFYKFLDKAVQYSIYHYPHTQR